MNFDRDGGLRHRGRERACGRGLHGVQRHADVPAGRVVADDRRGGARDDSHDEAEETLTLTLSNASGGRVADGEATGTIKNRDPLPRALLARFGRTAAVHVVEHVEERLQAPRGPGFRGEFAGRELRRGMERDIALDFLHQLGASAGAYPAGAGLDAPMDGSLATGAASVGMAGLAGGGPMAAGRWRRAGGWRLRRARWAPPAARCRPGSVATAGSAGAAACSGWASAAGTC